MDNKTNILVQYDGGGYDGCIWEWNYFYIDENSIFNDVSSSGTGGIKTLENALDLIENNGNSFSNKVYIYHLDSKEDMKTFATESACPHIQGVIRWFNDYNSPIAEPFAICSECGCEITFADDIYLTDIRGCGGTVSTADNLVCPDCYTTCEGCGEYSRDISEYKEEYLCEYCIGDRQDQEKIEDQRDLLFQSLATGSPDMFSDDMRWIWGG